MVTHNPHLHNHPPAITRSWKWLASLGNATIGLWELAVGQLWFVIAAIKSSTASAPLLTLSVVADGLHNLLGDALAWYMQAQNVLHPGAAPIVRHRRRLVSYWALSVSSGLVTIQALGTLAYGRPHHYHASSLYAAMASLVLTGWLLSRVYLRLHKSGRQSRTIDENDILKHFWKVDVPSALLAVGGATLQRYNVTLEQVVAAVASGYGAYAFRPTSENLARGCHGHSH